MRYTLRHHLRFLIFVLPLCVVAAAAVAAFSDGGDRRVAELTPTALATAGAQQRYVQCPYTYAVTQVYLLVDQMSYAFPINRLK